jgi:xanthine dehydrogenase accessory factor
MHWHRAIGHHAASGEPYVIATVLATTGSTPRASSSKMVITAKGTDDTIGGGQFEYLVIEQARELLAQGHSGAVIAHFPLAAAATQCCGGSVTVLLEPFAAPPCQVAVFGAGHVGERVVALLADLPVQLRWLDARADRTGDRGTRPVPCEQLTDVEGCIASLAASTEVMILTHDHQLDYDLTAQCLRAGVQSVGLIGSQTKRARFAQRLAQDGFASAAIERVRCPIGDPAVQGKEPMAIAVGIVADLLRRRPAAQAPEGALSWQQIKAQLVQVQEPSA